VPPNPSLARHPALDDWLSVTLDGRIVLRTGKVDIGQRISTALGLIAAEELDLDMARVEVNAAETGVSPDEGITSGSNSIEHAGEAIRLVAATARHHLLSLAAKHLEVEVSTLDVADGSIASRATNRTTSYWELCEGKPLGIPVDLATPVKSPDEYRLVGQRTVARGMVEICTGSTRFVHDMVLPGMVHARIIRPPQFDARLVDIAPAAIGKLDGQGVALVRDGSFVAVAHKDEYRTVQAAARVAGAAEWRIDGGLEAQDVHERLLANDRVSLPVRDGTPRREPVPEPIPRPPQATTTLKAQYERPYQIHGSIGPSAALAVWESGQLSVWSHSQAIYLLRASLAEALDIDVAGVRVVHAPGPGCYGHNGADDAALDAALVARALPGKPILLKWSREDEHAWEPYGPCMVMDMEASLDGQNRVVAWSHESYSDTHTRRPRPGPGRSGAANLLAMRHLAQPLEPPRSEPNMGHEVGIHRNLDPLYTFPQRRLVKHLVRDMPLRTSALRSLGAFANIFAIESFVDELAGASSADPLEFRLQHLDDARAKAVLEAMADRLGWRRRDLPTGWGQGIAFARYKNAKAYAAVGIELEVTEAAEVRLHRAVIAADAGQVIDPGGLTAQLEGGLMQSASMSLYEEVRFDATGITSRDWDSYPILRFDNVPEIDTILMGRPSKPCLGAGEATAGPTPGAIANAICAATGLRLRRLPFTPDTIRMAALA